MENQLHRPANINFNVFGLIQPGFKPTSTALKAVLKFWLMVHELQALHEITWYIYRD
jgi:hypothetical protein